jgi:hypothetical protein
MGVDVYLYVCVKSFRDLLKDGDKLESIFYVGISFHVSSAINC